MLVLLTPRSGQEEGWGRVDGLQSWCVVLTEVDMKPSQLRRAGAVGSAGG